MKKLLVMMLTLASISSFAHDGKFSTLKEGRWQCQKLSQGLDSEEHHRKSIFLVNCIDRVIEGVDTNQSITDIKFVTSVCSDNSIFYVMSIRGCYKEAFARTTLEEHFLKTNKKCEELWVEKDGYKDCMAQNL